MVITAEQVKSIRQELDKLRPASTLSGNRELSVKQTILALAPALERMKKRGFELPEIIAKLAEKGIEVKPQTLTKYVAEARRQKDTRKTIRQASSPHSSAPKAAYPDTIPIGTNTAVCTTDTRNSGTQWSRGTHDNDTTGTEIPSSC